MNVQSTADAPKYVRFARRLRGIPIDFMLFLGALVIALQITVNSGDFARVIGFGFIAGFFLYEPLLVSFAGGTIGWYTFISMTATRRHQAVQDILTRSTVQIRDPSKALPTITATSGSSFPTRECRRAVGAFW